MWSRLRHEQLGYKFRRQHSFGKYIMDFYCPALWLAIEVDGSSHSGMTKQTKDEVRQKYLEHHLLTVIRFTNEQVLNDLETVLMKIKETCDEIQNSPPFNSPLGRGEHE